MRAGIRASRYNEIQDDQSEIAGISNKLGKNTALQC